MTKKIGAVSAAMIDAGLTPKESRLYDRTPLKVTLHQEHTPGPFPLRMDAGRNPDMHVIVTNQGNHYATTYDPTAARLILAGPELLGALRTMALLYSDSHLHLNNGSKCAICEAEGAINKALGVPPAVRSMEAK